MAPRRGPNRGLETGVVLLAMELFNVGVTTIPPVTLFTIAGQVLLYVGTFSVPWEKWDVCISTDKVLSGHEFKRLFLSTFEHGDDMHLYYNMISFLIKGRSLEPRYGSTNFAFLLVILCSMTNIGYVLLGQACAHLFQDPYYLHTCAIGFSGVIFALKVLTSYEAPASTTMVAGTPVPTRYAAWVELIVIHLLVPRASFMGHLAGILAGVLYCKTFVGTMIDNFITGITGEPMVHDISFYHH
ncbi:rhomboid-related protein 4 [Anabrus simplex]|uniref:rhomboid-related protein 4 n=1 Tax=Anabrus simplex TaxID=316456 RepID=UPI0035A30E65